MSRDGDVRADLAKARRLAWLSLAYLCSTVTLLFVVMSGSQALKTEFVGDGLSMIAPVLFLIGGRISARPSDERYPYGYERSVTAGYLGAAIALLAVGVYLFVDSASKLVFAEHPIVGGFPTFGHVVWTGWLAIPTLLWSSVPAFFLGRAKMRLGERLHDKVLIADARTNAADWQSAGAAIIGVLGIAAGLWWLDSAAALFISLEILRSGFSEVRYALGDIMDRRPQQLSGNELDPLPEKLTEFLKRQPWVRDAVVRVRERGREFSAEAYVVPVSEDGLLEHLDRSGREACALDRRLHEIAIAPVPALSPELQAVRADGPVG